jgi:hypothetical protein
MGGALAGAGVGATRNCVYPKCHRARAIYKAGWVTQ